MQSHVRVDVHGGDGAVGAHDLREERGVVAGARAYLQNPVARLARQLDSLLDDAAHRRVTFRVVDFDAGATLTYFFHLIEFGGTSETPVAAFDAVTGMSFKKSPKEVREVRDFIESLRAIARTPENSLEMIKMIRKERFRDS